MIGAQLFGVNLSGAEGGNSSNPTHYGRMGYDYIYPDNAYCQKVFDQVRPSIIRLPILWERIQHQVLGDLHEPDLIEIDRIVDFFTSRGVAVKIDLHNYGSRRPRYGMNKEYIGKFNNPLHSLYDLWLRLAPRWAGNQLVYYGVMNEPKSYDFGADNLVQATIWVNSILQFAVDAIRQAGAKNYILAPGYRYTGAHDLISSRAAERLLLLRDPIDRTIIEVHQYLDPNDSGHSGAAKPGKGATVLQEVRDWAEANGKTVMICETGSFDETKYPGSAKEVQDFVGFVKDNPRVFAGIIWWGMGSWYSQTDQNFLGWDNDGNPSNQLSLIFPYMNGAN